MKQKPYFQQKKQSETLKPDFSENTQFWPLRTRVDTRDSVKALSSDSLSLRVLLLGNPPNSVEGDEQWHNASQAFF
jgi:hypothetical protein